MMLGGYGKGTTTAGFASEWPVSYHGTKKGLAENIAKKGFDLSKGRRFKYGRGVYSTPDPAIAEMYASVCTFEGVNYKVLVQNRVNMNDTEEVSAMNYFVTASEENIRPYKPSSLDDTFPSLNTFNSRGTTPSLQTFTSR